VDGFVRSSVSSAVISFVADAISRRRFGALAYATSPVEASTTSAFGADTVGGGAAAEALAAPTSRSAEIARSTTARKVACLIGAA